MEHLSGETKAQCTRANFCSITKPNRSQAMDSTRLSSIIKNVPLGTPGVRRAPNRLKLKYMSLRLASLSYNELQDSTKQKG